MTAVALRHISADWDVTGFTDPFVALDAVKARPADAVLADQMMPGMLGSELLERLRTVAPLTLRIIMSGHVTMDKLALITSAHQYVAKPFDPIQLRDLMRRSFAAQERIINRGLQTVATSLRAIPSLPQAHHSLMAELKDNDSQFSTIARLIANDPGLSVKVLQLANSSLFGRGYLVTDLVDAVNCLGTEMLTAILLSQSIFRHYESLQLKKIDLPRVWAHCWKTACVAQRLCRDKQLPRQAGEEAFLAGLLHEVGRFILIDNFSGQYEAACESAARARTPLAPCLRETFQASPCQLAAYVLELWGLPAPVVEAIAGSEKPEEIQPPAFGLAAALYIADRLASLRFPPDEFGLEDWKQDYLQSIGCAEDIPGWEEQVFDSD